MDEVGAFDEFFRETMQKEISELAAAYPEKRSLPLDFKKLEKFNHELADALLENPDQFLKSAETAVEQMNIATFEGKKLKIHCRLFNLPENRNVLVQYLGAEHLDKLVSVEGAISLVAEIKPLIKTAVWECFHCGAILKMKPEKNILKKPDLCRCGRRDFKHLEKEDEITNMQNAKMQDLVENMKGSAPAANVSLWLEDDLVNILAPGEKFKISGILRRRPITKGAPSSVYDKMLEIIYLERSEKEFEALEISKEEKKEFQELATKPNFFDIVVDSVAPSIFGYRELKLAIALQLFGGNSNKVLPDGKKIRGDPHILIIGDPGTAKSAMLQYVKNLAPKCIYVGGKGASGVGLTASAERDEFSEGWVLKAGAMVLASGGQVNIDEFDKMDENDRSALHEAMEQQQISIAKAGIVTTFKAKTAVLAAANPKLGRFDPNQPPASQFDIPPTLQSRFDLIFPIKDVLDEVHDRKLADHVLLGHRIAAGSDKESEKSILPAVPVDKFRKYIAYARQNFYPVLGEEALEKIRDYYLRLRKLGEKQNNYPVTARQIEGLVRLSEASARARLSNTVDAQDADRAITLTQYVLETVFMDKETGKIDSDIVNIGQAKSRTDKARTILEIIESKQKEVDLVSIEDVVREAQSYGMDEQTARKLLEDLYRQNEIIRPKHGFVATLSKRKQ